ncbi:MAG TPA: TIM barrel protein [Ilumatobacteraceae bacterium]|nr:TIM barrel protein [Ilumatobacteraceae bacterium]
MTLTRPVTGLPAPRRFSVCQHVLRLGDLARDVEAAVGGGASAISLNAADFGGIGIAEAKQIIADSGLAVSSYIDPALMRLGPVAPDLDALERSFGDARELGAPCFLFIAGDIAGRDPAAADQQLVDALSAVADRVAGSGVSPMIEPLHPIARELSYVHTLSHALDLAKQVPGTGVVVDTGASWWERDLVAGVAANLELVFAVQITDVRADEMTDRRYVRAQCGAASAVPVADLVHDFLAAGYEGWFEHEVLVKATPRERIEMVAADRQWFESLFGAVPAV